jgi:hypothetical protein
MADPSKVWDTQAQFQEGTFVNCEATVDGKLVLSAGQSSGYWQSQIYEALSWTHWSQLAIVGVRPTGANVYYRFRSGATSVACAAAAWSPYADDMDADGRIDKSVRVYYLNALAEDPTTPHGAFFQLELTLEAS